MNDFTIEELEALTISIHHILMLKPQRREFYMELQEKITAMIDNYCEHEWENICCQCNLDKIYCHHCKKDMGDLKQRYEEC